MGQNASMMLHRTPNCQGRKEEVTKLLFAAGEKVDGITYSVPECIRKEIESLLNLKHLCRETIRKHLINIEQHSNLFTRLPQLGLPSSLTTYLLYDLCVWTKLYIWNKTLLFHCYLKNSFADFQDDIFLAHFSSLKCVYPITVWLSASVLSLSSVGCFLSTIGR